MNLFEPTHLIIVAVIVLLLFGGEKLPELMRNVGKGVGELKKGIEDGKRQLAGALEEHRAEEIKFVPPKDTIQREEPEEHRPAEDAHSTESHGTGS
ncbi:MAG TPA: twin-arginine translocase TatA/TatE family subunit [Fimbriimonadaceae bacterium]|nr:twin-arginine translocase TatA/TatE family subunit [Fimbriimonadaceae bacterium]